MSKDLNGLIREVLEDLPDGSTRDVATEVASRTPSDRTTEFYTEALLSNVAQVIARSRNVAMDRVFGIVRRTNHSPRIERRKNNWAVLMDEELVFGGQRKRIGDCNKADLMSAAQYRRNLAESITSSAERLEMLADALDRHGVEYARELPADAITMSGAA